MNTFLEIIERGDSFRFSELLEDIPSDDILREIFPAPDSTKKYLITHRDLEVLKLVLDGHTQAEAAEQLNISQGKAGYSIKKIRNLRTILVPPYIEVDIPALRRILQVSEQRDQEKLSFLTERQREVWLLYEQGSKRKEIAEKLGITYNAVSEHIHHAEQKFREYERYCAAKERNQETVVFPLTRGEVKIIMKALQLYEQEIESDFNHHVNSDWAGKLPFEANVVAALYEKAQTVIFGKILQRMPVNMNKE